MFIAKGPYKKYDECFYTCTDTDEGILQNCMCFNKITGEYQYPKKFNYSKCPTYSVIYNSSTNELQCKK